ncbi:hypothetical protein [Kitasatospora kifunensis]|uniref:Uncharacterized protein n=1 Tax=Kitasatospora kifunensis TaxID=58351 RepID=A0A7W7QYM4_KITKI|nr:hypothetical protein [Kitasatospora kifunensis]MBB4922236.1 hypothetical protein [Kitasatospora kifunensis]
MPITFHELIAAHSEMLARIACGSIATEPVAFVCQLGELVDDSDLRDNPSFEGTAESLRAAVTLLAEALDRPASSQAQIDFLQAADKHLHDLAADAIARRSSK